MHFIYKQYFLEFFSTKYDQAYKHGGQYPFSNVCIPNLISLDETPVRIARKCRSVKLLKVPSIPQVLDRFTQSPVET